MRLLKPDIITPLPITPSTKPLQEFTFQATPNVPKHLYQIVMEDIVVGLSKHMINFVRLSSPPNQNPPKEVNFEIRGTYKP